MTCPICGIHESKVIDAQVDVVVLDGDVRLRRCPNGHEYSTIERVQLDESVDAQRAYAAGGTAA